MSLLLCKAVISQDAQDDYLNSSFYTASQIIGNSTQPPDVAAFQKVNFVPVSNYTGRANISIPIYEISVGSMRIPISIDYNTSGVKVNDMASSVGLNWSLNAGGMVSRMIKGMDDFSTANQGLDYTMSASGWLGYQDEKFADYNIGSLSRYNDAEPDLFQVNAPGLSTKYIHERAYSLIPEVNGQITLYPGQPAALELEHKGSRITEIFGTVVSSYVEQYPTIVNGLKKVEIETIDGIVYHFSSPDISKSAGGSIGYNTITKFESLRLDTMFDPSSGQTVKFEYLQYSNYFYDEIDAGVTTYGDGTYLGFNPDKKMYTYYPCTQRLTKIVFDEGEVDFVYGLNRLDNTSEKALTDIIIRDHLGNTVKHFRLSYSYFQSSIDSAAPQSKRLRLDSVFEVDAALNELPGYTFTYDKTLEMPPRTSYAHDYLGYNNGSYNSAITDPIPKFYFIYRNELFYDKSCYISPINTANPFEVAIQLTGNYSLVANENYAKTYSLTEMTLPTGGKNIYEYELNEFYYNGAIWQGGGIRIKSQILNDGIGNIQALDYSYSDGAIANFPTYAVMVGTFGNPTTLAELTSNLGIDTFMAPQSQIEFTQGSFVGYSSVIVKNRLNNSFTQYRYKSPSNVPNIPSILEYDPTYSASANWVVLKPPTLHIDLDYLRGKILNESIFDKDGEPLLDKQYIYTQKNFDFVSIGYLSTPPANPVYVNCYLDGVYQMGSDGCGGYYEILDLPTARDLLTTIITRDYRTDERIYGEGVSEDVPFTFQTEQSYVYDNQLPLIVQESKRVSVCDENGLNPQDYELLSEDYDDKVVKNTSYPRTYGDYSYLYTTSSLPYASTLANQNRLSNPLTIEYKNKNDEIISKEEHHYSDFEGVIALEKINFISRDGSIDESEIVTKRDEKGRIIEYKKKNGVYVSRLYGYDQNYLIAEVVNSTYSDLLSNLVTAPYPLYAYADEEGLRGIMNELRGAMPESKITSYTHKPLVGISSITDPRGETSYYEYDNFNRLNLIKNSDGDIVQKTNYHYQIIPFMDVTTSVITANPSGSAHNVSVSTNVSDWTVSDNASWVSVVRYGDQAIITVVANDSGSSRSATVTFSGGGLTDYITVNQAYTVLVPSVSISPTTYTFSGVNQTFTIQVTSNTNWTVLASSIGNWITATPSSGSNNGSILVRCVGVPSLTKPGYVRITNTATGEVKSVTVYWSGAPEPL